MDFQIEDDLWWAGAAPLPSWAGFQSRQGAYGGRDDAAPSDGTVRIVFAPEGRGLDPLTADERALVDWFLAHEAEVSQAVMAAILRWCAPDSPERLAEFGADMDLGAPIPDVAALRARVGLHAVNIHPITDCGPPYLGFELACDWEEEHGLGVLMHGSRAVKVGYADTACLLWIAEEDAEEQRL